MDFVENTEAYRTVRNFYEVLKSVEILMKLAIAIEID
jgi:hypothetical protein